MKFPLRTLHALLHEPPVLQMNRISIFPCGCRLSVVFSATGASTTLQAVGLQPGRSIDMRWGQTSSDEIYMPRSDWSCRSAQMHVWEGEGLILSHLVFLILRLLSYSRVRSELCIFTPQAPPPPPTPPQPSVCQFSANCVRARGDAQKKKKRPTSDTQMHLNFTFRLIDCSRGICPLEGWTVTVVAVWWSAPTAQASEVNIPPKIHPL